MQADGCPGEVARAVARPEASGLPDTKGPQTRAFFHSPGWTRTNNPPVNSRMLCQLSYRGSLGRKSLAKLAFHLVERIPDPCKDSLQLHGAREVVAREVGELAHDKALFEP